jgi:hypothetical protein
MPIPIAQLRALIDHGTQPDIPSRRLILQVIAPGNSARQAELINAFHEELDQLALDEALGQNGAARRASAHELLNQILDASL